MKWSPKLSSIRWPKVVSGINPGYILAVVKIIAGDIDIKVLICSLYIMGWQCSAPVSHNLLSVNHSITWSSKRNYKLLCRYSLPHYISLLLPFKVDLPLKVPTLQSQITFNCDIKIELLLPIKGVYSHAQLFHKAAIWLWGMRASNRADFTFL